jgi:hypothetical protein
MFIIKLNLSLFVFIYDLFLLRLWFSFPFCYSQTGTCLREVKELRYKRKFHVVVDNLSQKKFNKPTQQEESVCVVWFSH